MRAPPAWLPRLNVSSAELDALKRKWEEAGRQVYANAIRTGGAVLARTQSEIEALGRAHVEQEKLQRDQQAAVRKGVSALVSRPVEQVRRAGGAVKRAAYATGVAVAEADRLKQAEDKLVAAATVGAAKLPLRFARPGTPSDPGPGRLTTEWALGAGPEERVLGPESSFSREFVQAPSVQEHLRGYIQDWRQRPGGISGAYVNPADRRADFGVIQFIEDLAAGNGASHFVGSWGVGARRNGDKIDWAAENDTDTTSLFYGRPLREAGVPYVRSYPRPSPGGRTHQTIRFSTDLEGRPIQSR